MKDNFSKYLKVLILLGLATLILFSSRKASNTNVSNTSGSTDTKDNLSLVGAEQVGSSPESNATSRLKQVHDWLVSKGANYGNAQPSDWSFDFGTYWNRILYSAFWEPDGTATESDVLYGKTFYSGSNNRVQKTGTITPPTSPGAYDQQFETYCDYGADGTNEEAVWTKTNTTSGSEVWYDTRSGLYWSYTIGYYANAFSSPSTGYCDFFNTGTYPTRGSYGTSGTDPDCGNAINACAVLSHASTGGQPEKEDWYLPSQKELHQAYIDGILNKAGTGFLGGGATQFQSSTELAYNSTRNYFVMLARGDCYTVAKSSQYYVKCVRRD